MILPTKQVPPDRAPLVVGAEMLGVLVCPMTVSMLWDEVKSRRSANASNAIIDFRWFVLALDLLYIIGAVELDRGLIRKAKS